MNYHLTLTALILLVSTPIQALDREARLKKIEKMATPGESHLLLAKLTGDWKVRIKVWLDPNDNPEILAGKASFKQRLGKRFIEQDIWARTTGKRFEAIGYLGYDNTTKKFVSSWLDNQQTNILHQTGDFDATTNAFTFLGHSFDPVNGNAQIYKNIITLVGDNLFSSEIFVSSSKDTKAFKKIVESTYKRDLPKKARR